jgi:hypothetical protein
MSLIRELAWRLRDEGKLDILQKGKNIDPGLSDQGVKGPIRLRKRQESEETA